MDWNRYLKHQAPCPCGQHHACAVKEIIVEPGALSSLRTLTASFRQVLLVADENTFAACGKRALEFLAAPEVDTLIFSSAGWLVPDESALAKLNEACTSSTDLLLGVGSGVINDLCKYVSFERHIPYAIVACAPSMDGYASSVAALLLHGCKVTKPAHVPAAVIADTDILAQAPMELIQAGFGDMIGKYSALNDWRLSQIVTGEALCPAVYQMTAEAAEAVASHAEGIRNRDSEAIQLLMEGLLKVGIAMSYAGNSRPASGSEHHLSHFFEVTGLVHHRPYLLHGTDVAYSTYVTASLREQLGNQSHPISQPPFHRAAWRQEMERVYAGAAEGVIALQERLGWHQHDFSPIFSAHWAAIQNTLQETKTPQEIDALLSQAGLSLSAFASFYSPSVIRDAVAYAKDLKDRFTILWMI